MKESNMKFYTVSDSYIAFLKNIDKKVLDNYGGKRPFIGIILNVNNHEYLAPLTSHKLTQDKINSSSSTVMKLHERGNPHNKLGMIQINNMIPIIRLEVQLLDIENQPEPYRSMLYKQYEYIKTKTDEIQKKAEKLYKLVIYNKQDFYCRISCDFKLLEENYRNFTK
jgi:protein AbiQ